MASLINIEDLTLNPEEAHEIGQLIIERAFTQGPLSDDHAIETGITMKQQIPFAGRIADSMKKADGCTPNEGSGVTLSEKFWDPEIFDSRWKHCAADLDKLFKLFKKAQRINPDFYDQIDSEAMGLIYALIDNMLAETLPYKAWFSDKAADYIADGGNFKAGTDLDLYNVIDGLWKQIFAEAVSGTNHVAITQNAGASYVLQALGTDAALGYLTAVMTLADSRLLEDPSAKFLVTRSVADNYRNTLRTKNLGAGFLEVVEGGRPRLFFDGFEVKVRNDWDRFIDANQNNGTKRVIPHRIVFTTPDNIPVGTLSTDDLSTLDSFYDRTLKSNIVDVAFSLDAKMLEDYMIVSAY
jgi:hypothetical protein